MESNNQNQSNQEPAKNKPGKIGRILRILGPGIITGAADDDPSGIATYSQTGAQFGFGKRLLAIDANGLVNFVRHFVTP